jgi:hypothetical protein
MENNALFHIPMTKDDKYIAINFSVSQNKHQREKQYLCALCVEFLLKAMKIFFIPEFEKCYFLQRVQSHIPRL